MADDYGNFISNSTPLPLGSKRNGSIEVGFDQDMFAVNLVAGHSVTLEVARLTSPTAGGLGDPYIALFNAAGTQLAYDDSSFGQGNARLHYSVPTTGTYYAVVYDYDDRGTGTYSVGAYRRNIVPTTNFDDILTGGASPETFFMGRGNDTCRGGGGDDLLDGGDGLDTVTYAGRDADFTIERVWVGGWSKTGTYGFVMRDKTGAEGTDILVDVERMRFSDIRWALDLNGNAGTTVKLIGAIFGREAVQIKEYVGIGLAQLDGGTSRDNLIALALQARFGGTPTATDLVNVLYTNVVGVAPGAAELKLYTDMLNTGVHTPITLAGLASDTDLNLINIGFNDLVNTGIGYV